MDVKKDAPQTSKVCARATVCHYPRLLSTLLYSPSPSPTTARGGRRVAESSRVRVFRSVPDFIFFVIIVVIIIGMNCMCACMVRLCVCV